MSMKNVCWSCFPSFTPSDDQMTAKIWRQRSHECACAYDENWHYCRSSWLRTWSECSCEFNSRRQILHFASHQRASIRQSPPHLRRRQHVAESSVRLLSEELHTRFRTSSVDSPSFAAREYHCCCFPCHSLDCSTSCLARKNHRISCFHQPCFSHWYLWSVLRFPQSFILSHVVWLDP